MPQKIRFAVLAVLALAPSGFAFAEDRKCVFSIEVVSDGGGLRFPEDTAVGNRIFIFEYPSGELVAERYEIGHGVDSPKLPSNEVWGKGEEFTSRIRDAFKKAHLRDADLQGTQLTARQDLANPGTPVVIGARKVKVHADLEGTTFTIEGGMLGSRLEYYSRSSPVLIRLQTLMDVIAFESGRTKFFLD
jgi:hypothetical protein